MSIPKSYTPLAQHPGQRRDLAFMTEQLRRSAKPFAVQVIRSGPSQALDVIQIWTAPPPGSVAVTYGQLHPERAAQTRSEAKSRILDLIAATPCL